MLFCSQSLSGHTSAVETVRFGHDEDMVVAGSASGALKVWDLEAAKSKLRECRCGIILEQRNDHFKFINKCK